MPFCTRCGQQGSGAFCAHCGSPMPTPAAGPGGPGQTGQHDHEHTVLRSAGPPQGYSQHAQPPSLGGHAPGGTGTRPAFPAVPPPPHLTGPTEPTVGQQRVPGPVGGLPADGEPADDARPRRGLSAIWIVLAVVAVLLVAGGVTAAVLLTRGGTDVATPRTDLIMDYPRAPRDSVTVRLNDFVDVDDEAPDNWIGVVSVSADRIVVDGVASQYHEDDDTTSYNSVVAAVNHAGTILWQIDGDDLWDGGDPGSNLACSPVGTRIVCETTSDSGTVVTSIDPADGTFSTIPMESQSDGSYRPPIALGDDILTRHTSGGSSEEIGRFDLTTQKEEWTLDLTSQGGGVNGRMAGKYLAVTESFSDTARQTDLIDPDTGQIVTQMNGVMYSGDGSTWFGNARTDSDSTDPGVLAVQADGTELWEYSSGEWVSLPASADDVVVMVAGDSDDGYRLFALDPATGDRLWTSRTLTESYPSVTQHGATLLVSTDDATSLLDARTGKVTGHAAGIVQAVSDSQFYTYNSDSSSLYAYAIDTGKQLWRKPIDSLYSHTDDSMFLVSTVGQYLTVWSYPDSVVAVLLPRSK